MSEQIVTSLISAKEVRAHVEHITTAIPSRLAGSENARRMAEYSAAALGRAGVAATILEMLGGTVPVKKEQNAPASPMARMFETPEGAPRPAVGAMDRADA